MGILWHAIFARFKSRLSLLDLQKATEDTFDLSLRNAENAAMFQALRDSDPQIDHPSRWWDEFQSLLERIASKPSRKGQAAECRKIILDHVEERSILWAFIVLDNTEIREELIETFFPDLAPESILNAVQLVTKQYLYYLLDGVALAILYTQQFNATVKIDSFDTTYDAMCKVGAEIMVKKVLASGIIGLETTNESPTSQVYRHEVVEPLEKPLEDIKRNFRENLFLLSPANPDSSQFLDFLNTYSKQLEAFKQLSPKLR